MREQSRPEHDIAEGIMMLALANVSNGSKLAIQFRVQVGTELELFQRVLPHQETKPHQTRGFLGSSTFSQGQIFGSNSVFEL